MVSDEFLFGMDVRVDHELFQKLQMKEKRAAGPKVLQNKDKENKKSKGEP